MSSQHPYSDEIYNDNTCNFTMLWYELHQLSNSKINRNKCEQSYNHKPIFFQH